MLVLVLVAVVAVPVVIVVAWAVSGVTVAASVTYSVLSGLFPKLVEAAVNHGDGDSRGGCGCCACSRMKQFVILPIHLGA